MNTATKFLAAMLSSGAFAIGFAFGTLIMSLA